MSPGVNAGIMDLAKNKLLSSVSIIADAPFLRDGLSELLLLHKDGLQFHLHFNLTHGQENKSLRFQKLLFKCIANKISKKEIEKKFLYQLEILKNHHIPISGLDGHHHVHLLPLVYTSIEKLLIPNEIKTIRTMVDIEHKFSFLQSFYFKKYLFDPSLGVALEPCGYLLAKNLSSKKSLIKKINTYSKIIIHPAKFDDFKNIGIRDKLQKKRVDEFNHLMEFFA